MAIKQRLDSPTNNFATLNPLNDNKPANTTPLSEGNTKYLTATGSAFHSVAATMVLSKKHYWEVYCGGGVLNMFGIIGEGKLPTASNLNTGMVGYLSYGYSFYGDRTALYNNNNAVVTGLTPYTTGDIVSFCFDADTGNLWYAINGNWQQSGDPSAGTNPLITVANDVYTPTITNVDGYYGVINFGQDPTFGGNKNTPATVNGVTGPFATSGDAAGTAGLFYYPPPAGALALCTANLQEMTPTVNDDTPQDYFKAVIYTGQTVGDAMTAWDGTTGTVECGFQPDLVWLKGRDNASWAHFLQDGVRGFTNFLKSNTSDPQSTTSPSIVSGVHTDGFYIKFNGNSNNSGDKYVAWCWKSGGAPTADNSNTSGAMTANSVSLNGTLQSNYTPAESPTIYPKRMSINTDAGFSIVKYVGNTTSGATIPHGLTKRPDLIFFKNTNTSDNWIVYNFLTTDSQFILNLNLTGQGNSAANTASWYANNSYFKVEQYNDTNGSGPIIAYCWHSVEGYSKFGSYIGNGSTDGTFVYTGFRPAFVLYKQTSGTGGWSIFDAERESYNQVIRSLAADSSSEEITSGRASDFLSNGFKWRNSIYGNSNNQTYIYMAFAEQPFNYANAR